MLQHVKKDGLSFSCSTIENTTCDDLRDIVRQYRSVCTEYDTFIFYFSGHGEKFTGDLVMNVPDKRSNKAYLLDDLRNDLLGYKCTKVVLLDSCYSGRFISGLDSSFFVLTSTSESQTGANFDNWFKKYSPFTKYLVASSGWDISKNKKTKLKADKNNDGKTTLRETYDYISKNVPIELLGSGKKQDVQIYGTNSFILFTKQLMI